MVSHVLLEELMVKPSAPFLAEASDIQYFAQCWRHKHPRTRTACLSVWRGSALALAAGILPMIVLVDGMTLDSAEQPHVPVYEQILLCPIPSEPHVLLQPCERKQPTSQSRFRSVLLVHLLLNLVSLSALGRSTVQLLKHASELHLEPQIPGSMKPSSSGQPLECEDLMLLLCFQNFQNESRGILAQAAIDEWLVQSPSIACSKFRGCRQRQPVEGPELSASHAEHRSASWYHFSSPLARALPDP
mmetsp:Transcript_65654/g.133318  ORF Transcript_65654/g.133318 Transcript_65654/m.133318 type:complete len:245 (+) Transcript_65654:238-972(+)